MRTRGAIPALCAVMLLVFAGCLSGGLAGDDGSNPEDRSNETCYLRDVDPTPEMCLVDERPPNITVTNEYSEPRNVSIHIRENSTVTHTANMTVGDSEGGLFRDVIRSPGEYEIEATVEGEGSDSARWTVEERYNARLDWIVEINVLGNVSVYRETSL